MWLHLARLLPCNNTTTIHSTSSRGSRLICELRTRWIHVQLKSLKRLKNTENRALTCRSACRNSDGHREFAELLLKTTRILASLYYFEFFILNMDTNSPFPSSLRAKHRSVTFWLTLRLFFLPPLCLLISKPDLHSTAPLSIPPPDVRLDSQITGKGGVVLVGDHPFWLTANLLVCKLCSSISFIVRCLAVPAVKSMA